MTPRDFLSLGEELIEGDAGAHWRTAISRAYYAAFHAARLFMQRCRFVVPDAGGAHRYLGHRLANSGHDGVAEAGKDLEDLRDRRNEADYDLWRTFTRKRADELVTMGERIIEALEEVQGDPASLFAITQAMRDYERGRGDVTWKG